MLSEVNRAIHLRLRFIHNPECVESLLKLGVEKIINCILCRMMNMYYDLSFKCMLYFDIEQTAAQEII